MLRIRYLNGKTKINRSGTTLHEPIAWKKRVTTVKPNFTSGRSYDGKRPRKNKNVDH